VSSPRAAFRPDPTPPPAPGRSLALPREARLKCVRLVVSGVLTGRQVAKLYGVGKTTVYRWADAMLEEPGPDGDLLRRLARR
jgi:transposase-like protein